MRYIVISIFCISILLISCKKDESTQPNQTSATYTQMLFDREGGGNLIFTITPTSSRDTLQFFVTQKAYRDTSIQGNLMRNTNTTGVFDTLLGTLNGQYQLIGNYAPDTIPTGTWAFVYMVNGSGKTNVTNVTLRNTLLEFESFVLSKL